MFKRFKKNSDHKSDVCRSMSNILQYLLSIYKKIKRNIYVQWNINKYHYLIC